MLARRRSAQMTNVRQQEFRDLVELHHDAKTGPCADCHVQYPMHVMQLDHRPGSGKLFGCGAPLWGHPSPGLAVAVAALGSKRAALLAEIAKCDLVCANCHADRTYRRRREQRPEAQPSWCRHGEADSG
jgi:hypothetical protein